MANVSPCHLRSWGYYELGDLPALVEWLESGNDAEQDLAETLHALYMGPMPGQARAEEGESPDTSLYRVRLGFVLALLFGELLCEVDSSSSVLQHLTSFRLVTV